MELVEIVRHILGHNVIPAVQREGIRHLHLPDDLGACDPEALQADAMPQGGDPGPNLCCYLGGVSYLWVDSRVLAGRAGDLLLLPPHVRHSHAIRKYRVVPTLDTPMQLCLSFSPTGTFAFLGQAMGEVVRFTRWCALFDRRAYEAANALVDEIRDDRAGREAVGQGLLLEVLGRLQRAPLLPGWDGGPEEAAASPHPATAGDLVAAAQDYLRRHYDEPLSLSDVAAHLAVSRFHLSRRFRQATGQTLIAFLTEVRIDAAKRLLQTRLPIGYVARLVGFSDRNYFSRAFHRVAGMPPREFRTACSGDRPPSKKIQT